MTIKTHDILFTAPGVAELVASEKELTPTGANVLVKTEFTAVSAGTERDNLMGEFHINGDIKNCHVNFPRQLGYSGIGTVIAIGPACKQVKVGDRVIIHFGKHTAYNLVPESKVFPLMDGISPEEAALIVIASFPIEGVRKARLELGESAMVMGLGILGLIGIQLCRIAGAAPVIAADPNPERRTLALTLGADYALDSTAPDFAETVKSLTGGAGVNVVVDSAGVAAATIAAFDCMARFGRMTLLGCTRHADVYDFYHAIHAPGVTVIGANNSARPQYESQPGNWTGRDDCMALQRLLRGGRLSFEKLISEIHSPANAPEVYARLAEGKFPIGVLFDWKQLEA